MFTLITNSHNSASEVGMNENNIKNENNPITIALLLNTGILLIFVVKTKYEEKFAIFQFYLSNFPHFGV